MDFTDHQLELIVINVTFPIIAIAFILLRFCARSYFNVPFKPDDYLMVIGMVFTLGNSIPLIYGTVAGGLGNHVELLSDEEVEITSIVAFGTQFPYNLAVTTIKLSLVIFYRNLFTTRNFRLASNIMFLVLALWSSAFFLATLLQMWPITGNWDFSIQLQWEINEQAMYNALAYTELATDIAILIMPFPIIWNLRLHRSKKWALSGIFLLGSLACLSNVVRIYYLSAYYDSTSEDYTYAISDVTIWSAIEPCIGIVAGCLPIIAPLVKNSLSFKHIFRLSNTSLRFSKLRSTPRGGSPQSDFSQIEGNVRAPQLPPFRDQDFMFAASAENDAAVVTTIEVRHELAAKEERVEGITVQTAILRTEEVA